LCQTISHHSVNYSPGTSSSCWGHWFDSPRWSALASHINY